MARHGPIYIQKEGTTNKITNAGIPMVVGRAANFKGPRGSHRTLSLFRTPSRTPWTLAIQGKRPRKRARASARTFGSPARPTACYLAEI
jgi:hypothetical protein